MVVANKCRTDTDFAAIGEFCDNYDLELLARIPLGDEVLDADAATTPLLDFAPDSPVIEAVQTVCDLLTSSPKTAPPETKQAP